MFHGSIVALITPMTPAGEIDYQSLKKLVDFHVQSGTSAIVAVGTTGESATLPVSEHINVVAKTIEYAAGRIPVIAGAGANSTAEAIELHQACAEAGADALLSVVPYYNKPQQRGVLAHFLAVADACDVPTILYNVPSRTITDLLPETVAELATHKNIIGIKEATGDMSRLQDIKQRVSDDFVLLSGDDASTCQFILEGGHGVISVTANVAPEMMARMCAAAEAGDADKANALDKTLSVLHHGLFNEPNPVLVKYALCRMGYIASPALRLPLVEAELASQKTIEQQLKSAGINF